MLRKSGTNTYVKSQKAEERVEKNGRSAGCCERRRRRWNGEPNLVMANFVTYTGLDRKSDLQKPSRNHTKQCHVKRIAFHLAVSKSKHNLPSQAGHLTQPYLYQMTKSPIGMFKKFWRKEVSTPTVSCRAGICQFTPFSLQPRQQSENFLPGLESGASTSSDPTKPFPFNSNPQGVTSNKNDDTPRYVVNVEHITVINFLNHNI